MTIDASQPISPVVGKINPFVEAVLPPFVRTPNMHNDELPGVVSWKLVGDEYVCSGDDNTPFKVSPNRKLQGLI